MARRRDRPAYAESGAPQHMQKRDRTLFDAWHDGHAAITAAA